MKNKIFSYITTLTLSTLALHAASQDTDFDFQDYSAESPSAADTDSPFSFTINADWIGKSKIKNTHYEGDKFSFRTAEAELGMVVYYDKSYKEAINLSVNYSPTHIEWEDDNPWFDQENFHIVSFSVGASTQRLCKWLWRGQANINADISEISAGFSYCTYDFLLWGRYEYCNNIGIHAGLIVETGMRTDRVYPILGVDWAINSKWKLNLVLPVNVSLEYYATEAWTLALEGRNFSFRDRVGRHEANPRSVVRYNNVGAEFAAKFTRSKVALNLHAGATLGGRFRVADPSNHHPRTYKFDSAAYAGGEFTARF